jgi:hypothetical protein
VKYVSSSGLFRGVRITDYPVFLRASTRLFLAKEHLRINKAHLPGRQTLHAPKRLYCLVENTALLRAAHVSAQRLPRFRALTTPVHANFRLVATATAAATVLPGVQGDASPAAAVFSLCADVAASAAVISVEYRVGTYAVAAEVFRRVADVATGSAVALVTP